MSGRVRAYPVIAPCNVPVTSAPALRSASNGMVQSIRAHVEVLTSSEPSDVLLGTGTAPGSEPETRALLALIAELRPDAVIALHAPLACIDDANSSALGQRLAKRTGMPLVADVGYPTPGPFGSWGQEHGVPVITYEFPVIANEDTMALHVPVFVELLTGTLP